jgi:hypothetical protein
MKKFLVFTLFIAFLVQLCPAAFTESIDTKKTYNNAYRWTGGSKDKIRTWAAEVEDRLLGTSGVEQILYTPTDTPTGTTKGTLYYDLSEEKLKYRNASSWVAIESGSAGNSLDGAYDVGSAVTVDSATVGLTATDSADVIALTVTQSDTGSTVAQTIVNASTGAALSFDSNNSGNDILGSDSTWSVGSTGTITAVVGTWTGDQTWTGSNANIVIDVTDDELLIEDDAQISFGDAADVTVTWDATNLLIEALAQDTGIIKIGATNALDFNIYGSTATDIASFDAGAGALLLDSYPLALGDGDAILLGDTLGTGDFSISDASDVLLITQVADGTGSVAFSADGEGMDVKFFTDTASSYILIDEDGQTNGSMVFEATDLHMMDGDVIYLGDSIDFSITATNQACTLGTLTSDETSAWNFGADTDGDDVKFFGATTAEYFLWDASGDYLHVVGDKTLLTQTGTTVPIRLDATGTVAAGNAIEIETTSGPIQILADGATTGDITLDAEDDIILTTTGALTITNTDAATISGALTVTGATGLNGAVLGDGGDTLYGFRKEIEIEPATSETVLATDSGKVFATTAGQGAVTYTLPTAAAGLVYTFVDVSATAADDLKIQAAAGDTINGGTAAKIYECVTDTIPATVTLVAIDETQWVVIAEAGTWANNNS